MVEMEKENLIMKKEVASYRSLYHDAISKVRTLEGMLLNAESVNESLQRKFNDYNILVDECNAAVSRNCKLTGRDKCSEPVLIAITYNDYDGCTADLHFED